MHEADLERTLSLEIGTLSRCDLLDALAGLDIGLNDSAVTLLEGATFSTPKIQRVSVISKTVGELGLASGAVLDNVYEAAQQNGLRLCPVATGPYLRMTWVSQKTAPDAIMSNGRAPTGSVTVASPRLSQDPDYPRGFYLRVIDGRPWLRGYRCDDDYLWSPDDCFAFAM